LSFSATCALARGFLFAPVFSCAEIAPDPQTKQIRIAANIRLHKGIGSDLSPKIAAAPR
jgi:hypothetical protein